MIRQFQEESAQAADFDSTDAETCGWVIHKPDRPPHTWRAEKYTPGSGMSRVARAFEGELLEEIFQIERLLFEKEQATDRAAFKRWEQSVEEVRLAYNDELEALKAWADAEDERAKAEANLRFRGAHRDWLIAAEGANNAWRDAISALEDEGHEPSVIAALRDELQVSLHQLESIRTAA
jgi:hypothetical protein